MVSGLEFTELFVLNEDIKKIGTPYIDLKNMIDEEATLVISASPYDVNSEQILEEFMISGTAKGNKKMSARSQQFDGNMYLAQIDISKKEHSAIAVRINYSLNDERLSDNEFDSS